MSAAEPQTGDRRPPADPLLQDIADYVVGDTPAGVKAYHIARYCLMDALGCAVAALAHDSCRRHVGPVVPGATLAGGARVPGTVYELDPVQAAYSTGCMVRWLDYNDTWLAAEWGHPSDNLGALLACLDYLGRRADGGGAPPTVRDLLTALIKAYEIQGVLALDNSFNRVGFDHVILVKVASAAVATGLLGGDRGQVINAVSNAWADAGPLRVYRHAPNTGWRKSWAAGDATARGLRFALQARAGEMGYPTVLSTPRWGLQDVLLAGQPLTVPRPFGNYVMENILFKIAFPVEFHAQTAVECAIALHPRVRERIDEIETIELLTQESALRIIDKTGALHNPADRDHCLQYAVAVGLLFGELDSRHYSDRFAADPRIDALRERMDVREDPVFTRDYLDPDKRSIGNAVTVRFRDGRSVTERIEYPLGHRRRRREGLPLVAAKFAANLGRRYSEARAAELQALFDSPAALDAMPVSEFLDPWTRTDRDDPPAHG